MRNLWLTSFLFVLLHRIFSLTVRDLSANLFFRTSSFACWCQQTNQQSSPVPTDTWEEAFLRPSLIPYSSRAKEESSPREECESATTKASFKLAPSIFKLGLKSSSSSSIRTVRIFLGSSLDSCFSGDLELVRETKASSSQVNDPEVRLITKATS